MKPGDLIEWVYRDDSDRAVVSNDMVWSSIDQRWAPIGGMALLVACARDTVVYVSQAGLFRAHVTDEIAASALSRCRIRVVQNWRVGRKRQQRVFPGAFVLLPRPTSGGGHRYDRGIVVSVQYPRADHLGSCELRVQVLWAGAWELQLHCDCELVSVDEMFE